jgi:ABC-type sugar transport system ATPase subunit
MATVLQMQGIDKSFGGVHALTDVAFDLQPREVHALVGQNGAGKSTLIKILAGALQPDAGMIRIDGEPVTLASPAVALQLRIGTVYQDPLVYPELSVTENIFTGRELRDRLGNIDQRAQVRRVQDLLRDLNVDPQLALRPMGSISVALQQLALIAKALSWAARVMVFDEPTAILTVREAENLFAIIRKLRDRGVGIIYISHRLEEIFSLADRVTVLKDGQIKGTWPMGSVSSAQLIELMAGHALFESVANQVPGDARRVLSVRGLSRRDAFQGVDFDLQAGEILGFFGLVGAGRSEVAQALFGVEPADAGEVRLHDRPVRMRSPSQALRLGIAYLPEDRKGQGLFGTLTLRYNTAIAIIRRLSFGGTVVRPRREDDVARRYLKELSIKAQGTTTKVSNLSGGNQQKVVLAKWLATEPRIFILDEPTRGIDVSSKQEIHNLIVSLARKGVAIMLISSELPEVLRLSDRVVVMREGQVTGRFARAAAAGDLLAAAMGGRTTDAQHATA